MKRFLPSLLIFILMMVSCAHITGCGDTHYPQPRFDLAFSAPEEDPVYIEQIVYDDAFTGVCGILTCCWKKANSLNVLAPPFPPVPKKIFVRWFNYKQQKYYEATVNLPKNADEIMLSLPELRVDKHFLTTGVKPDGEVVVWVSNHLSELTGTWIEVAKAQGHEAKGDPAEYSAHTEDMRKEQATPSVNYSNTP